MATNFQSWRDPMIIMLAIPGAIAGLLWMLVLSRTTLNVRSLMDSIMAVGVASPTGISSLPSPTSLADKGKDPMSAAIDAGIPAFAR